MVGSFSMSTEAVPLNPTLATQTLEPLLSINETARILAVSPATIRTGFIGNAFHM
jgi:hypothetical protein